MHSTDDRWRVYDLNIEGMSLVANYRAQFNKIIRTSSYEALVGKFKLLLAESSVPESEGRPPRLSNELESP